MSAPCQVDIPSAVDAVTGNIFDVFAGGAGALCLRVGTDADTRNPGVADADASACAMDAVVGYVLWWTKVAASSGRSWISDLSS